MSNKTVGPSALLSINDAAALKVRGLTLDIKPGQDLNGYDHPWIGGCGKNLWPPLTTTTYNGITYTQNSNGSVKVNGTATSYSLIQNVVTLPAGTYTLSIGTTSDLGPRISVRNISPDSAYATIYKDSADFTLSSDTEVRMRILVNANTTVNNAVIWPMLRLASNTNSNFEPYENICPISGWTEANVLKRGKNLCSVSSIAVGDSNPRTVKVNISDIPAGNYYVSFTKGGTAVTNIGLQFLNASSQQIAVVNTPNSLAGGCAISLEETATAVYMYIGSTEYGNGQTFSMTNLQVEVGNTKSSYVPYTDITTSISLPSTAGTVYGGTLDVVNKELTVTRAIKTLTQNDIYTIVITEERNRVTWSDYSTLGKLDGTFICDRLKTISNGQGGVGDDVWEIFGSVISPRCWITVPTSISSVQALKNWIAENPVTIIYELATPLTYSLTDDQFITLFQGSNNLWSECGDLTLTYKPLQLDKIVDSEQLDEAMVITADAIRAKSFATDEIPWNLATGFKDAIDTITGTGGVRIIDEPDGNGGIIRQIITDAPIPIINPAIENINFYDYDGAVLYSYTPSDFLALIEMPPNPNHTAENLTAQGWNWSLSNAKEHVTKYGSLDIGQTYITADGKTHIHIFIPEDTPTNRRLFTLRWRQTVSEGVTVDWGDGTSTETFSGTSVASHDHTYTNTGEYDITLTVTSGNLVFGESQSSGGYAIYGTVSNATIYKRDYITKIEIGDNVSRIDDFSFYCCHSLQSITIPKGISYFGWYVFERCVNLTTIIFPNNFTTITEATCLHCYSLKNILLPDSITTVNGKPFSYCYALTLIKSFVLKTTKNMIFSNDLNLKSVYVSDTLTELGSSVFNSCPSLTTITLPATLTKIGTQTFYGCYCLSTIHILATTPPTLENSNAFTGIPSDCVIYVPYSSDHSILNAYKAATNWSSYTSYLQEEPQ